MDVYALFISPTGNTATAARSLARGLADVVGDGDFYSIDITPFEARKGVYDFGEGDVVVIGVPTYAGRVPNKLLPYLQESVQSCGAKALAVVTYGNRAYDDALKELCITLDEGGFDMVGAVACVGEHAFTDKLAGGRPNEDDIGALYEIGKTVGKTLKKDSNKVLDMSILPGREPESMEYYVPKKTDGERAVFLKDMPLTDETKCNGCGECRAICPMGCFRNSVTNPEGTCIKCQACVKVCPNAAKYFDSADLKEHIAALERDFANNSLEIQSFLIE